MHLCRSSSNVPRLPSFLEMVQNPHVLLTFDQVHNPLHLPRETTSQRPIVARTCGVVRILTSKCASRHNGAHFFDISEVFVAFSLANVLLATTACTFRHLNVQKCSEREVLVAFSLANVLLATTACIFFDIATSKSAPNVRCF